MTATSTRDQIKLLLQELKQDVQDYRRLQLMLLEQRDLLISHDSQGLQQLQERQHLLMETLSESARQRVARLRQLGLSADDQGMQRLLSRLPEPLRHQANASWHTLHQLLQQCQTQNDINGRLLASQVELVRKLLQPQDSYPQPLGN